MKNTNNIKSFRKELDEQIKLLKDIDSMLTDMTELLEDNYIREYEEEVDTTELLGADVHFLRITIEESEKSIKELYNKMKVMIEDFKADLDLEKEYKR